MKKIIFLLIIALSFNFCTQSPQKKSYTTGESYATLVAYQTKGKYKKSSVYLELNSQKTLHKYVLS